MSYDYSNVSTDELKRRLDNLERNTSAQTFEQEVRRMAACSAMHDELRARQALK